MPKYEDLSKAWCLDSDSGRGCGYRLIPERADLLTVDPALVALAEAAEQGDPCPLVRLYVASGAYAVGTPVSVGTFFETNRDHLRARTSGEPQVKGKAFLGRRSQDEKREHLDRAMAALAPALGDMEDVSVSGGELASLNLIEAQWWTPAGKGLAIPAVRIPLAAVNAWWLDGAQQLKAADSGGGGGGLLAGAAIPLDG